MMQAAREAVAENEDDDPSHITACFGGTWQKRGHTSLNGIISFTFWVIPWRTSTPKKPSGT
jgi:hypothetical protein